MDFIAKINELRAQKGTLLASATRLAEEGNLDELAGITAQMEQLNGQITNLEALHAASMAHGDPAFQGVPAGGNPANGMTAREKAVKNLADAARRNFRVSNAAAGTPMSEGVGADGGYTVPEDIVTSIINLRDAEESLLEEVTVNKVTTRTGRRTMKKRGQHQGFTTVAEAAKIGTTGTPEFETVEYAIEKRSGVLPVTQELYDDSDANIAATVESWLASEARVTANNEIVNTIKADFEAKDLKNLDGIKSAWIGLGTAFRKISKIITNDSGLLYLSNLKDKNDRYLLHPNPADPQQLVLAVGPFIIPIKPYDDDTIPNDGTKIPFFIGAMKEAIHYWDRQSFTIKPSDVAVVGDLNAYEQDLILWKGSLRDDCTSFDKEALVNGYIDTAAAAG